MQINYRGDKITVTPAIKDYVAEKLSRLDRYFENAEGITAYVLIKVKYKLQTIEVTVPTSRFTLRAEVSHEDLYAATDLVTDVLERQIRKNKTRLNKRYKDSAVMEFKFDYEVEAGEEDKNKIVKRKNIEMKPMDEEEAILEMNLLGHEFFVYKDMHTNKVCVLYKRKDGNYGLIETN